MESVAPPHSREAEEALIGSVLISPDVIRLLDVQVDDFYVARHRSIWQAFMVLERRGITLDFVTICDTLDDDKALENVGGSAYLAQLVNNTPTSMNAAAYAEIVMDKARRRRTLKAASQLAKAAYDESGDMEAATNQVLNELVSNGRIGQGAVPVSEFASQLYDEIEERAKDPREVYGIPTGFADFDRITAGLQRGELLIISGEPGLGKTLFTVQMGAQMASGLDCNRKRGRDGVPGVIYELEMGGSQLVRRIVSGMTGIRTKAMRSGKLQSQEWEKLTGALNEISDLPLYVSDATAWTTAGIRGDLMRLQAQHGIEWFLVDYLLLLKDRVGRDNNEIERTDFISRSLRQTAKDLHLAGIAVHSMTKAGMDRDGSKAPGLDKLRGSGQLSYHADVVIFMNKHIPDTMSDRQRDNMRTMTFAKYREDDTDRYFHLVKRDGLPAFVDYAKGY